MSQNKTTETPAQSKQKKYQCHIHDEFEVWKIDDIRENVCVNDEHFTEHEGKHYCLFHLPTKDKNIELFNEKFRERLKAIEKAFKEIEKLPEGEQTEKKDNLCYDFRYVWFPSEVNLWSYKFIANADFRSAMFTSAAFFSSATFTSATFFSSATFSADAFFSSATFTSVADFRSATFMSYSDFFSATFSDGAFFFSANFLETSQINFDQTSFQKGVDFGHAIVKGYLYFEAGSGKFFDGEWLDEEKRQPKKVERKTSVFEGYLEFAYVRAEKPERIIFNKVRLCPNWFVNVDSRKFVFTDIAWENHKAEKEELKKELINLSYRSYKKPHNYQLLTIAFRNLAANAEEFNRFEQASNFRKSASECERLERLNKQKDWKRKFKQAWNKKIFCRRVFAELYLSIQQSVQLLKEKRPTDSVHFLYRYLSFYGESWVRAFYWLLGIWAFFALTYYFVGEFGTSGEEYLDLGKSFGYSLLVMILQKPDPRPFSGFTNFLYGLETILAPLQAALLALAIRRKFMR